MAIGATLTGLAWALAVAAQTITSNATVTASAATATATAASSCFDCNTAVSVDQSLICVTTLTSVKGCQNYGNCSSISNSCSCIAGYGGNNCLTPLCNSVLLPNYQRSPLPANQSVCSCDSGFSGPVCGVCESDNVCPQGTSSGISITVNQICNKSPVIFSEQNAYCVLDSPLLKSLYPLNATIVLDRNTTHRFGSLWYDNVEQFMCEMSDCSQSIQDGQYTQTCTTGTCKCAGDSTFCGGPGVVFNIQSSLASASGKSVFSCNTDGTNCNLEFDFLSDLFPSGLSLTTCNFGECAYASQNPYLQNNDSSGLSTAGIVGIVFACIFVIVVLGGFIWSLIYQLKARQQPVPPPSKGVDIGFTDVSYTLPSGKVILSGITSTAPTGSITAILGPSGAGKSTLLDILAGKSKQGFISGKISYGGVSEDDSAERMIAYVDQDDLLLPSLTVRETLLFSANLRLPEGMSKKEKAERVDEVISTLGLSHVSNSRIGGFGIPGKGISGGERRRVSIGVELVTSPGILFLDEPTSGLDAFNAHAVVDALHALAHVHQKTVIFTVHQPRSDVYALFDHVLVLAAGSVLYSGRGVDCASKLKEQGSPCPDGYNIADHLLDLAVQVSHKDETPSQSSNSFLVNLGTSAIGLRKRKNVSRGFNETDAETAPAMYLDRRTISKRQYRVGFLTQLSELVNRAFTHLVRTPSLLLSHLSLAVILGVFVGGVYYHSDDSLAGLQNRLGSLFFILSLIGFSSLSAVGSLASERGLLLRERSNNMYGSMPYYLSKILCDILPLRVIPAFIIGTIAFFMVGYDSSGAHYPKYLVLLLLFSANMGLTCICLAVAITDVGTATLVGAILILFKMLFAGLIISQGVCCFVPLHSI
ncbi:hypothetical protein HDU84_006306 [Entophlyctis sp. JEL0112]|nr:hypothetical protein HDU84_006306 [Entophlyctis sp. JEL0112]